MSAPARPAPLPSSRTPGDLPPPGRPGRRARLVEAVRQWVRAPVLRQIVGNPGLSVLTLKTSLYGDSFANESLRKIARLVEDAELRAKIARHHADEEKHARLLAEAIVALGGEPAFTPVERDVFHHFLAKLDQLHDGEVGLAPARLDLDRPLAPVEIIRFLAFALEPEWRGAAYFRAHLAAVPAGTRIHEILTEIVADEERHVGYLTAELERFARAGLRAEIRDTRRQCRRRWAALFPGVGHTLGAFSAALRGCGYRPVGRPARLAWLVLRPLLAACEARTRAEAPRA